MPNYDYQCKCGVREEFRPYSEMNLSKYCKICGHHLMLVYIKAPATKFENPHHTRMKKRGARMMDDREGFHVNNIADEVQKKQRVLARTAAERTVRELLQ